MRIMICLLTRRTNGLLSWRLLGASIASSFLVSVLASGQLAYAVPSSASEAETTSQLSALKQSFGVSETTAKNTIEVQDAIGDLPNEIEEDLGSSYADVWFDPVHARFDVGVAPSTQKDSATLASLLAAHGVQNMTNLIPVRSTYEELLASLSGWTMRVGSLMQHQEAETMIDAADNAVVLRLSDSLPAEEVRNLEEAAATDAVHVRIDIVSPMLLSLTATSLNECKFSAGSSDYCSPPLVGGTEIFSPPVGGYYGICTSGFMAESILPEEYPDHYLLTAGHCFGAIGSGYETGQWASADDKENAHAIGYMGYRYMDSRGDAAFINLNLEQSYWEDSKIWGWYPYIYTPGERWGWSPWYEDYPINIVGTNEAPNIQYQTPCHVGYASGITCGVTEYTNVTLGINYEKDGLGVRSIGNLVQNSACASAGDSGGPWLFNNYAMGLTVSAYLCPNSGTFFDDLHATDHALGMRVVGFQGEIE